MSPVDPTKCAKRGHLSLAYQMTANCQNHMWSTVFESSHSTPFLSVLRGSQYHTRNMIITRRRPRSSLAAFLSPSFVLLGMSAALCLLCSTCCCSKSVDPRVRRPKFKAQLAIQLTCPHLSLKSWLVSLPQNVDEARGLEMSSCVDLSTLSWMHRKRWTYISCYPGGHCCYISAT